VSRVNLAALMGLALGASMQKDWGVAPPRRRATLEGPQVPLEPRVDPAEAERVRQELRAKRQANFDKRMKKGAVS